MKSLFSFFFIFNFIYLLTSSSSLAAIDIGAGEQIFTANCAACHAGGNNVIMPNKTLVFEDLEKYSMNSIDAITTQVSNGKTAMPAFGGRLSDDDIQNVANYVLGQSKAGW